jgi:hypothetical protein
VGEGLGLRVQSLGFKVEGVGFVADLGIALSGLGLGFRVERLDVRV